MLFLYHPKDMHPLLFCNNLENIVSSHKIKIVSGDFNINFYDETDSQHVTLFKLFLAFYNWGGSL